MATQAAAARYFEQAVANLRTMLGGGPADEVVRDALAELGGVAPSDPQGLLGFALALSKRGGLVEVIGRCVKVQAIAIGAKVTGEPGPGTPRVA